MLTQENLNNYLEAKKNYQQNKDLLVNEVDRVIKVLAKFWGGKYHYWWFCGAAEGEVGELKVFNWTDDYINVEFDNMNTLKWELLDGISVKYLFMSDEDIIRDCEAMQRLALERAKKEIQKKEKQKQALTTKKAKLLDSIKSKLSKEELKVLSLKD
jgi:hypothetical protein